MRVIIAGSRNFSDYELLEKTIDNVRQTIPIDEIVSGTATGADSLGEHYAKQKGLEVKYFPADWASYGKAAGAIRNKQMSSYADMCIVFWDSKSKGTKNMIQTALKDELYVKIIRFKD